MRGTTVLALALVAAPLAGQSIDWRSSFLFYGDNTEFFTPYRTGETILGSSFTTTLALGGRAAQRGGGGCVRRHAQRQRGDPGRGQGGAVVPPPHRHVARRCWVRW